MPRLESIQVGLPETYGDDGGSVRDKPWRTGFFKMPVAGPVAVSFLNLQGDGQADLRVHGGRDKAVLAYSAEHYPLWREELRRSEIGGGAFGENLTISGVTEQEICIGDIWRIGEVELQASQPRQPCWKLARRWGIPELPKLVVLNGRSGWYFRVLKEGLIESGLDCVLVSRPHPEWTISECNRALYLKSFPAAAGQRLTEVPELSDAWREDLAGRLGGRVE
ncbi:MOSC domain-containing protein [Planctomicrobium piriforme]|uniref:MOSC domain-containing protein YiiM n=1 Tax=Planctomicrobium piriforme TaxID=1576369 RepID=A0A1I3FXE0_9PLAN|nr:MOSC domain-containing protein [Planctomicrobium piriforme]SFI15581.1 MOSC domain-containing protein YiiM [Planctomicrobium piriforme]